MIKNLLLSTFLSLRAHKLRVFLTMVGIIIGIAAVVTVSALGEGLKKANMDMINSADANNMRVTYKETDPDNPESIHGLETNFSFNKVDMKKLRMLDGVETIYADYGYGGYFSGEVVDSKLSFFDIESVLMIEPSQTDNQIAAGRDFDGQDMDQEVVIITDSIMREELKISNPRDVIGKAIGIDGYMYKVIGVKKSQNYSSMSYDPTLDFSAVPKKAYNELTKSKKIKAIKLVVQPNTDRQQILQKLTTTMKGLHPDLQGIFEEDRTNEEMRKEMEAVLGQLITGLLLITAISLLVGGIGVMNIMYVSVSERKREIGIRRAIGAKPRNILLQFLMEAAFITLIGGIIGIIAGYGLSQLIATFADGLTPVLSLRMSFIAAGVSTGIGLLFGVIPALKAARLDPIKAIYM